MRPYKQFVNAYSIYVGIATFTNFWWDIPCCNITTMNRNNSYIYCYFNIPFIESEFDAASMNKEKWYVFARPFICQTHCAIIIH